jgi:hypothetical protein
MIEILGNYPILDRISIGMTSGIVRQQDRAIALLSKRGMARLSELTDAGITAATVSRME